MSGLFTHMIPNRRAPIGTRTTAGGPPSRPVQKGHPAGTFTPATLVTVLAVFTLYALYRNALYLDAVLRGWPVSGLSIPYMLQATLAAVALTVGAAGVLTLWHSVRYCVLVALSTSLAATPLVAIAAMSGAQDAFITLVAANVAVAATVLKAALIYRLHLAYTKNGSFWSRQQVIGVVWLAFAYAIAAVCLIAAAWLPSAKPVLSVVNQLFLYLGCAFAMVILGGGWLGALKQHRKRLTILIGGCMLWVLVQVLLVTGAFHGLSGNVWLMVAAPLMLLALALILTGAVVARVWFTGRGGPLVVMRATLTLLAPFLMIVWHEYAGHYVHETFPTVPKAVALALLAVAIMPADYAKERGAELLSVLCGKDEGMLRNAIVAIETSRSRPELGRAVTRAVRTALKYQAAFYTFETDGSYTLDHSTVDGAPQIISAGDEIVSLLERNKAPQEVIDAESVLRTQWHMTFPSRSRFDRLTGILAIAANTARPTVSELEYAKLQRIAVAAEVTLDAIQAEEHYRGH
jgi:hypothetical protein